MMASRTAGVSRDIVRELLPEMHSGLGGQRNADACALVCNGPGLTQALECQVDTVTVCGTVDHWRLRRDNADVLHGTSVPD